MKGLRVILSMNFRNHNFIDSRCLLPLFCPKPTSGPTKPPASPDAAPNPLSGAEAATEPRIRFVHTRKVVLVRYKCFIGQKCIHLQIYYRSEA